MKKISAVFAALTLAAVAAPSGAAPIPKVHRTASEVRRSAIVKGVPGQASTQAVGDAIGVGVNLDVVGRLSGGGTLFKTSVDIANNTATATTADAYFVGLIGGSHVEITVGVSEGGLFASGTTPLSDHAVFHTDDFIDDLKTLGLISQAEEDAGILGSLFVVFNNFDQIGQGSVQARFYSEAFGGTIGVSANGHELTTTEPLSVVGIARNTVGEAGTPQVYTNFFVNNEGFATADGHLVVNPVQIRLTGYSNSTGQVTGQSSLISIGNYETVGVSKVWDLVHGTSTDDTLIVFVDIITGNSAISGLSSTNDNTTKDPSAAQLRPADWSR